MVDFSRFQLVPSAAPIVDAIQSFSPQAQEQREFERQRQSQQLQLGEAQLAGLGQQQEQREFQMGQAQREEQREQVNRDTLRQIQASRSTLQGMRGNSMEALKGDPEGLVNRLDIIAGRAKQEEDPEFNFEEFAMLRKQALEEPDATIAELQRSLERVEDDISFLDEQELIMTSTPLQRQTLDIQRGKVVTGLSQDAFTRQIKAIEADLKATKNTFDQASKLRAEVEKVEKPFRDVEDAFGRIKAAATGDVTAASDLALVFNFMKMLDPGSTVREGEFATAAKAAGLGERFIQSAKKVDSGEILSPAMRKRFVAEAKKQFSVAEKNNNTRLRRFKSLGKRFGLEEKDFILRAGDAPQSTDQPPPPTETVQAPSFVYNSETGQLEAK